jgi:hypothetical protein
MDAEEGLEQHQLEFRVSGGEVPRCVACGRSPGDVGAATMEMECGVHGDVRKVLVAILALLVLAAHAGLEEGEEVAAGPGGAHRSLRVCLVRFSGPTRPTGCSRAAFGCLHRPQSQALQMQFPHPCLHP